MKNYSFFRTMKKSVNEIWKYDKKVFVLCIIYTILATIIPLAGIYMPKLIITELEQASTQFENILYLIGGITIGIAILGFFETYIFETVLVRIMKVRIDLLTNIFDKTNRLDYHYTENPDFLNEHADAYNVVSNIDYESVMRRLFVLFSKVTLSIIYMYLLIKLSPWVVLSVVVSIGVGVLCASILKKYQFNKKKDLADARRKIGYFEQTMQDFSYGKDIRLYNFQKPIQKQYDFEISTYISVFRKIRNKEYGLGFLELFFVLISDALLYYFLITRVFDGVDIATFSFYLLVALALSTVLKSFVEDVVFIFAKAQHLNDYFTFMETEFNEVGQGIKMIEGDIDIEFRNVSFKYPKTDKWIIQNLNLKINKGEKIAIVGVNGAGKTTLIKLLLRFFAPTEGEILVNGINIKEYDKDTYQNIFAPVFQDINILAFTIRENITLGLSNDEERIWECLNAVGLGDKIRKLEKGLDTVMLKNIDESGLIFSGGENQKLAIARALYKNGSVVVLDEPTAALDALAEAEIYQNINELVKHKTSIFISHRLASTKFCDKIALFNHSSLQEYGNHDELMELKGEYYNMFVIQGKYYQKGATDEGYEEN